MARKAAVLCGVAAVMIGGLAAIAFAGEFGGPRQFCDTSEPSLFWRVQELPGDVNVISTGFSESQNGIFVRGGGTDNGGKEIDNTLQCERAEDDWKTFKADLGLKPDSLRMVGVGAPAGYGPVPKRIRAKIDMGPGADEARGHSGTDKMTGGRGKDTLLAGKGNDRIEADDGQADEVNCGKGNDKADVDNKDDVSGCERLA